MNGCDCYKLGTVGKRAVTVSEKLGIGGVINIHLGTSDN